MFFRRIINRPTIFIASVVALAFFAAREYYGHPLHRTYYEFTVDFHADGQHYLLEVCTTQEIYRSFPIDRFVNRPRVAAQRLPSGAAVLFHIPTLSRALIPKSLSASLESPDQLPFTTWLDNAEKPSVGEVYFSKQYYLGPSPRVEIKGISLRKIDECARSNPADQVPWLDLPFAERNFQGHYVFIVPEAEWSKRPAIAEALNPLDEFQIIPDEVTAGLRFADFGVARWMGEKGTIGTDWPGAPEYIVGLVRPLAREGDYLHIIEDGAGKAIYYPEKIRGTIRLRIGDIEKEIKTSTWYFDPVRRDLLSVRAVPY